MTLLFEEQINQNVTTLMNFITYDNQVTNGLFFPFILLGGFFIMFLGLSGFDLKVSVRFGVSGSITSILTILAYFAGLVSITFAFLAIGLAGISFLVLAISKPD